MALHPRTIRGPALFLSQYLSDSPPLDNLAGLMRFAAASGFKAVQTPIHDARLIDIRRIGESGYIDAFVETISAHGLTISEIAAHRAGQLLAVHPAYDEMMDALAAPGERGNPARRRARAEDDLRAAIMLAARTGARKVACFSGALAWPFFYPYPPYPTGLIDRAIDELAARWRPLLDAADQADVDFCFELHPGQDLHDGATFERFLDRVDQHPRAKILYDPSHMLLQRTDYLGFIDRYHARIAAFHVKDAEFNPNARSGVYGGYQDWIDRPGRFRSVGDGQIDFRGVFDRLTRYGYDGWATLEWECCLKNPMDGATEGARFIADHIIRVADHAFDANLRANAPDAIVNRMLGLTE